MNQNYFQNPIFRDPVTIPSQSTQPPIQNMPNYMPMQPNNNQTDPNPPQDPYAENILEKNVGRLATFYMSYPDSIEWRDRMFAGIIEAAGRDYALVSDPNTGKWNLLWTVYLDFVTFDEAVKLD